MTIMWSLNVFINDFPLPCRRVKYQSFRDIRLRPTVHKLSVSTLSDVNCHATLSYSKLFEII